VIPSPPQSDVDKNDILNDEEIQALSINVDELEKVRVFSCKNQNEMKRLEVNVRKIVKKKKENFKHVVIARKASDATKHKNLDYSGPAGPRYTDEGYIVGYSLLGSVEDFVEEALKNDQMDIQSPAVSCLTKPINEIQIDDLQTQIEDHKNHFSSKFDQKNALNNWQRHMKQRKDQQIRISNLLNKPIERLTMNGDQLWRSKLERRDLLNNFSRSPRAGYQKGAEFWDLAESVGDIDFGLKTTKGKTQCGAPFVLEQIGKPRTIQIETVTRGRDANEEQKFDRWKEENNKYFRKRLKSVQTGCRWLPHLADLENLEIICKKPEVKNDENLKPADKMASVQYGPEPQPPTPNPVNHFDGPSIVFCGQPVRWTGPTVDYEIDEGNAVRVNFQSAIDACDVTALQIENNGSTLINFDWSRLPVSPSFDVIKLDTVQRFYFDTSHGSILPNDVAILPVTFKSPNVGIFYETWRFDTQPFLDSGRPLTLILRGVATDEDQREDLRRRCDEVEKMLDRKEAEEVAAKMISHLIGGIRTPERCLSPFEANVTEQQIFERSNPHLFYNYQVVNELKQMYEQLHSDRDDEVRPEWNLSIKDLYDRVLQIEDMDACETLLSGINDVIERGLTSPPDLPITEAKYNIAAATLREMLDEISGCSLRLKTSKKISSSESVQLIKKEKKLEVVKDDQKKKSKKDRPKSKDGKSNTRLSVSRSGFTESTEAFIDLEEVKSTASELKPDDLLDAGQYSKYLEKFHIHVKEIVQQKFDQIFKSFEDIDNS